MGDAMADAAPMVDAMVNAAPMLTTISPPSATTLTDLTLTLSGSGFVNSSVVNVNGHAEATTFVDSSELTAHIAGIDLPPWGTVDVTVVTPSPGGGTSNAVALCVTVGDSPASDQTRARIGALYFDGWSGDPSDPANFHFIGLADGTFPGRQPLSGWSDGNSCAIEQQLAWAHSFGIEFFAFDWFYNASNLDPLHENLNSAFDIMRSLPDKHGMKYALVYVNQDPFVVPTDTEWKATVDLWAGYMEDPAYVRVNGAPLLIVIDAYRTHADLGSAAAVRARYDELRAAARAHSLPGVYLVAGLTFHDGAPEQDGLFPDLSAVAADGYDAASTYGFDFAGPLSLSGAEPFSMLADTAAWAWNNAATKSPIPIIPTVMDGEDHRSAEADHEPGRPTYWFNRDPASVASSVAQVINWADANPQVRAEPAPAPPLVMIGAWNELGNDNILVPTVEDGTSFGDAVGAILTAPASRTRANLQLGFSSNIAAGRLVDSDGNALVGATVSIQYVPKAGTFGTYRLSGQAPASATMAVIGFRVNSDDPAVLWPGWWRAGEGSANLSVYRISYLEGGAEKVPDVNFSSGAASWRAQGAAAVIPSDRGPGSKVAVVATPDQNASLDSTNFSISGGAAFEISIDATIAPGSVSSGYFFVAFEDTPGNFLPNPGASAAALKAQTIPFAVLQTPRGMVTTAADGRYSLDLTAVAGNLASVVARYEGDTVHWPALATATP